MLVMTLLHNINRTLQRRRNSTWHALGYDTKIREETPADFAAVTAITHQAFDGDAEVRLVTLLRQQCPDIISLVAEQQGQIVGHILFSPATLSTAPHYKLMALAPMAVSNVLQHQGIGSSLVRAGLEKCRLKGADAVVVLGHPEYYPRFGFTSASKAQLRCPWPAPDEAFMLLPLQAKDIEGNNSTVVYHSAFNTL